MQAQRSILLLALLIGSAESKVTFGRLKPSGDSATDKADAIAIGKLEKAEEQDEQDAKQMKIVADIEDKQGKAEEADSQKMEEDAVAIETAAADTAKEEDAKAEKELKDVPADLAAAKRSASLEQDEEDKDALHLKEVGAKEELDATKEEEDAIRTRKDAEKIKAGAAKDVDAEKADEATLEEAAKTETKKTLALAAQSVQGRCGPQTAIHLPIGENAAGATTWSDPFAANKDHPIGRYDVTQAKICGPGTFTFSPTSCGRMDYKPDIIEVSPKERSSGCEVVDLKWCSVGGLACMNVDC